MMTPRGFAPRTPRHALSRAAAPARSVRVARFASLARVVEAALTVSGPVRTLALLDKTVGRFRALDSLRDVLGRALALLRFAPSPLREIVVGALPPALGRELIDPFPELGLERAGKVV